MRLRLLFLVLVAVTSLSNSAVATHLRAGQITVERVDCHSLTFRITVEVFTNTINTNVLFGGEDDILDFGDGSDPDHDGIVGMKVPETPNTPRPDLGDGVATAKFVVTYTYSGFQEYVISYSEPNRNEGVINMDGSVNTRFYIETKIIVDPFLGCNNTPRMLVPPIDRACTGVAWFHNPGAFDPDGDSLSYELVIPFQRENTTVTNYRDPSNPKFYVNYQTGDETGTRPPKFEINPVDGTLTWDAPGTAGEYNIAFIVIEWKRVLGQWQQTGFVRRDMQIIVEDCKNERPDLIVPEDVCIEAGATLERTIYGIDPDNHDVKIEAFSEILNYPDGAATLDPAVAQFVPSNPPAQRKFQWKTTCAHIKEQPYQVVFKITDNPKNGPKLVTFKTWFIRVVGPKPKWVNVNLDLATRSASLQWEKYFCQNAENIQVWRRVDSFDFEPDTCQTGMPEYLGYEKIATLSADVTAYTDNNGGKGLASGATYCYRLLAVFPKPRGGESYVSAEVCLDPVKADKPIITHVTVDKTSTTNGQVTVKWLRPFEIDTTAFPPPYRYVIYRAEGFFGNATTQVGTTTSLTFTDSNINTEEKVYNYRIIAFDNNNVALDTSATASTVRLEAKSQLNKIELSWTASVPWSNLRLTAPSLHVIYRGPEGATENDLVAIDSVNVATGGFRYVDEGKYLNMPLEDNKVYCYRVKTRGGYGNPNIKEPFENFSQIICAQPGDENPPCQPETPIPQDPVDCQAYIDDPNKCEKNVFSNTIVWFRPTDLLCRNDVAFYRVYIASSVNDVFTPHAEVRDTFYTHANLPSFAQCYKISTVDRSGNESELSESVCFDNCPYYELPNVFTPNGTDECNKRFSAFSTNDRYTTTDESGQKVLICGGIGDPSRCARFVSKVVFHVYNRWGKEVYTYRSGSERTIYIDWDGRGNDGSDLATGIYYYVAEVTFQTVDPARQNKIIKGWVHLMR